MVTRLAGNPIIQIPRNVLLISILTGDIHTTIVTCWMITSFRRSSVFGTNKKFTTTWAVGLAWNLHNEAFIKNHTDLFNVLKLRASIGNPGNQNFGSYNTITTYKFNNWLLNNFGTGLLIDGFGDPDLEWQKTIDKNIGFDLSMFNNRFHVNFDYYYKVTDPLMASIGIPLSVGVSSRLANVGKQVSKGYSGTIKYAFVYHPKERINWTTSVTFSHGRSYYDKIGNSLNNITGKIVPIVWGVITMEAVLLTCGPFVRWELTQRRDKNCF